MRVDSGDDALASDSSTDKRYVPMTRKLGAVGQNWRQLGGWSRNMVEMLLGFVVVDIIIANWYVRGMLNISRLVNYFVGKN